MADKAQTFKVDLRTGGFVGTPNHDNIPSNSMVGRSSNINLNEGGKRTRGGSVKKNATAISGNPQLLGLYDYTTTAGVQKVITADNSGTVRYDYTNTIKSSLSTSNYYSFATVNNELYFCDGATGIFHYEDGVEHFSYSSPSAAFTVGETITGGTSGQTAVVEDDDGTNNILRVNSVSGAFTATETITGGTSGSTANIRLHLYNKECYCCR